MELDALILSRIQFALTICFHYLFPPLSIGLGWLMVIMEGMYLKTGDKQYEAIARFWTGIFAVIFAVGVASGIVMEFQFGTNWSAYSRFVGDVFGSALAAEGIFAFFLESGFLAVLVFGWDRVSPKMHFFSTVMVAVGALFSSVWITIANSWQQTPAGHHVVDILRNGVPAQRAEILNFWEVVFNPSSVHRLVHVWIGAGILGAFFVLSISSYYLLKNRHVEPAKKMFKLGLIVGLIMSVAAPISGHFQARQVAETQPAKLAAFEGLFETPEGGAPLYLWGFPDEKARKVHMGIAVPGMLSFLVHDNFTTPVPGLDRIPEEDWPPVAVSFYTYHIMIGLGMFFIGVTALATFLWWRGTVFKQRWLLWILVFAI
ncbi:MAG: cytochrome ubiquinol oxidase subunit I, partial [bacterium]|nr:cytochrome ubiquinol oxidase subunit I [bacterium]